MSVEQMAVDLKNNIEELTADLYRRYCTSTAMVDHSFGADLTFCCGYGE
ncbi:hypothetical protein KDL29_07950 [bacterium]|nr:hypothetical protein [bacterium]UNM09181.1 MAG: hypothetical protein H7A35_03805 [Planctomycetales bacterium]